MSYTSLEIWISEKRMFMGNEDVVPTFFESEKQKTKLNVF